VKKIFPNTNYKKIKDISDWPKDNFNFRVLIIRAKAGNDFDSTIP
jgi:hypothetical protein